MTVPDCRPARVAVVVTLIAALAQCGAPPTVSAVSPPPIDDSLLPPAASPHPPAPTVQRAVCTVPGFDPRRAGAPSQLDNLGLSAVWQLSRGAGQRVAVIGTGVSAHRRLPHLVGGGDYVFTGDGTRDCDGQGTLVAGIIAAAADPSADRFSGVAPEATLIAIRQSSSRFGAGAPATAEPAPSGVGDVDTLAAAVRTAADLGASVITIATVACAPAAAGLNDRALGAALAYAVDRRDAVVIAPAGDTPACQDPIGPTGPDDGAVVVSPAWYDDYVLTVGSVDGNGAPSGFTLAGPWVDVAAPGEAVLSLSPVGDAMANGTGEPERADTIAGTSYAAAVVSGLAALIRARFRGWTARQVMQRITTTAHHPPGGRNALVGHGLIDPLAAVSTDVPVTGLSAPRAVPVAAPQPPREPGRRRGVLEAAAALLAAAALSLAARALITRCNRQHVAGD